MLRSCFLSSFVEFRLAVSEKKSKMSKSIRAQGGHLVFPIGPKNTYLVEDVEILLSIKFRWIPFSGFWEVENVSANQRPGGSSCFFDQLEKRKLGRECWDLAFFKFRWIPFSGFRGEIENASIRAKGGHLVFPIGLKNTNLVEILLSVKFRWILFNSFWEVENVSANQRSGWPSCFSDRPEKHKLGKGRWDLAFYQVSLNSVERFLGSRKCLSLSEVRTAILFFRSSGKTQTW